MPDLLSRLSEKLDEVERAAENAKGTRVTTHGGGGLHAALWGPSDVLRLVAAHREVLAMHKPTEWLDSNLDGDLVEILYCQKCAIGESCSCCLDSDKRAWPCDTIKLLAAGWCVQDEEG